MVCAHRVQTVELEASMNSKLADHRIFMQATARQAAEPPPD